MWVYLSWHQVSKHLYINTPSTKLASYVYLYPVLQPPATHISNTGQQQHQDEAGKETHKLPTFPFSSLLRCVSCRPSRPASYYYVRISRELKLKYVYTQYHTATQKKEIHSGHHFTLRRVPSLRRGFVVLDERDVRKRREGKSACAPAQKKRGAIKGKGVHPTLKIESCAPSLGGVAELLIDFSTLESHCFSLSPQLLLHSRHESRSSDAVHRELRERRSYWRVGLGTPMTTVRE